MHQNFQNVFKRTTTDDATGFIYCIAFSIPIPNLNIYKYVNKEKVKWIEIISLIQDNAAAENELSFQICYQHTNHL